MIRSIASLSMALVATLAASSAFGQEEATGGKFQVGLRLGYGIPFGSFQKDQSMSDGVAGMVPLWLDLGYIITPNVMLGAYAHYAYVSLANDPSDACDAADESCSASDLRLGVQGHYHLAPGEALDPWFGLGIGYEMLTFKGPIGATPTGGTQVGKATYKGFEFANLQLGADFVVTKSLAVGPFASFSFGQFSSVGGDLDGDIEDKAFHEWLVLGVRGTLGL